MLFDTTWMTGTPGTGALRGDTQRFAVVTASRFADWELAWRGDDGPADVLRAVLLHDPSVTVLAATAAADAVVAGAVLHATGDCVGVSNVFAALGLSDVAWRGIVAWTEMHRRDAILVGYESGIDLELARASGFVLVGPLRVWIRNESVS